MGNSIVGWFILIRLVFKTMLITLFYGHINLVLLVPPCFGSYCQARKYHEALKLFEDIKYPDITPDPVILSTILIASSHIENLTYGPQIHSYITDNNVQINSNLQTSLITMYSKCCCTEIAQKLFHTALNVIHVNRLFLFCIKFQVRFFFQLYKISESYTKSCNHN
jgi:hypothetical protein